MTIYIRPVIVGSSAPDVAKSLPKGWSQRIPVILPQQLGLPDNWGGTKFGLGDSFATFDSDPALQKLGEARFELACSQAIPPGYGGITVIDTEHVMPWPTHPDAPALPPTWWRVYDESARFAVNLDRRLRRILATNPGADLNSFNNVIGTRGRGVICGYVPDDMTAAKQRLSDADIVCSRWNDAIPIISGVPEGQPTKILTGDAAKVSVDWGIRRAKASLTKSVLVWLQAETPEQGAMAIESARFLTSLGLTGAVA